MFIELTEDNLQEILSQNEKTLVMFGAPWCGNCKILKPKFKKIASEHEPILFVYVDADASPNSRDIIALTNIPTIVSFKGIENVGQDIGSKVDIVYSVLENIK
jgi:thiol-disulfide isomerase/thioredoxin